LVLVSAAQWVENVLPQQAQPSARVVPISIVAASVAVVTK
jgi:hypothetical protein